MHVGSDIVSREYLRPRHLVPHKGYLRFLADLGDLTPEEESWLDTNVEEFLLDLETTSMTKVYKIPTIAAFIDEEKLLLGSVQHRGRPLDAAILRGSAVSQGYAVISQAEASRNGLLH